MTTTIHRTNQSMPSNPNSEHESDSQPEQLPPASQSNRARQKRSRRNITHPIQFADESLEKTYNVERDIPKTDRKSELRRLH